MLAPQLTETEKQTRMTEVFLDVYKRQARGLRPAISRGTIFFRTYAAAAPP